MQTVANFMDRLYFLIVNVALVYMRLVKKKKNLINPKLLNGGVYTLLLVGHNYYFFILLTSTVNWTLSHY